MRDTVWCEYEVIGAIMNHGRKCLHSVMDVLSPTYFTVFELAEAYREMLTLDANCKEITSGSLIGSLSGKLTPSMKVEIARAAKSISSPVAARQNGKLIADSWKLREALKIASVFGQDEFEDVSQYIAMYADMLNSVAGFGDEANIKPWKRVLSDAKEKMFSPVSESRVHLGLSACDRLLNGIDPTNFLLIAARPAVGKSAFKEQIIRNFARARKKILNVSLEMPDIQIAERQTAAVARMNLSDIRNRVAAQGSGYDTEKEKIETAIEEMWNWDIDVYDNPNMAPSQLQRLVRMRKYDIALVDYGGLMRPDSKSGNREQEVAQISRACRSIALGSNMIVVVLVQLNRGVEHRSSNRVLLSDIRESGAWEQDAVQVVGLSPVSNEPGDNRVLFEVLKNRNGECGTQILHFDKPHMTFTELEERYEEPKQRKVRGLD